MLFESKIIALNHEYFIMIESYIWFGSRETINFYYDAGVISQLRCRKNIECYKSFYKYIGRLPVDINKFSISVKIIV